MGAEFSRLQDTCCFPWTLGFCTQRFQRSYRSWMLRATRYVGACMAIFWMPRDEV